ncbi:MAG: hypothetical protein ACRCX2_28485 [Paraclostridium sp.]
MKSIKPNELSKYRELIDGYDIYNRHLILTEADAVVYQILCLFFTRRGANHESLNTSFHVEELKFRSMTDGFISNKTEELNTIVREMYPTLNVSVNFEFKNDKSSGLDTLFVDITISGEIYKTQLTLTEQLQVSKFEVKKDFTS